MLVAPTLVAANTGLAQHTLEADANGLEIDSLNGGTRPLLSVPNARGAHVLRMNGISGFVCNAELAAMTDVYVAGDSLSFPVVPLYSLLLHL